MQRVQRLLISLGLLITIIVYGAAPVSAQLSVPATAPEATEAVTDTYGRQSPRSSVEGYLSAIRQGSFELASKYLDMNEIPLGERQSTAITRARQLNQVLDRNGYVYDIINLSNAMEGKLDDNLAPEIEQVGVVDPTDGKVPLLMHRVKTPSGGQIWLFEPETLRRVPFMLQIFHEGPLDRLLPESLKSYRIGSVSIGHWIAVILAAVVGISAGLVVSWLLVYLFRRTVGRRFDIAGFGLMASTVVPLGIFLGVLIYRVLVLLLGIQLIARENINWMATIASWMAICWLGWRLIDGFAEVVRIGMAQAHRQSSIAVVMLARRVAKALLFAIASISILDTVGVDVTTGLAALGIGGLALALGAQKTIENLVGSVTVVADKPVRVGDFCKFGDVSGTVEDIGIRSTRIRTLDRTVVTVPNGAFASMQIENYTLRDQMRFYTMLTLRYETTPDQIRFILAEIQKLLWDHQQVSNAPARVRFVGLGSHSLDIEVFAYVTTSDYNAFLVIQEGLLLAIMDIVANSGTDFAFPSQTLYFGRDSKPTPEAAAKIHKLVKDMPPLVPPGQEVPSTPPKASKRSKKSY